MEEDLKRIEQKIDKVLDKVTALEVISGRHDVNLENHMHRSVILEERTDVLFSELEPIRDHISQLRGMAKVLVFVASIGSVVIGLVKLFSKV